MKDPRKVKSVEPTFKTRIIEKKKSPEEKKEDKD